MERHPRVPAPGEPPRSVAQKDDDTSAVKMFNGALCGEASKADGPKKDMVMRTVAAKRSLYTFLLTSSGRCGESGHLHAGA